MLVGIVNELGLVNLLLLIFWFINVWMWVLGIINVVVCKVVMLKVLFGEI